MIVIRCQLLSHLYWVVEKNITNIWFPTCVYKRANLIVALKSIKVYEPHQSVHWDLNSVDRAYYGG